MSVFDLKISHEAKRHNAYHSGYERTSHVVQTLYINLTDET
jgi:hypothetical protein